jgi:hypothetical protein
MEVLPERLSPKIIIIKRLSPCQPTTLKDCGWLHPATFNQERRQAQASFQTLVASLLQIPAKVIESWAESL